MTEPIHLLMVKEACTAWGPICWMDDHEGAGVWIAGLVTLAAVLAAFVVPWNERRLRLLDEERHRFRSVSYRNPGSSAGLRLDIFYLPNDRSEGLDAEIEVLTPLDGLLFPSETYEGLTTLKLRGGGVQTLRIALTPMETATDREVRGTLYILRKQEGGGPATAKVRVKVFSTVTGKRLSKRTLGVSPVGEDEVTRQLIGRLI